MKTENFPLNYNLQKNFRVKFKENQSKQFFSLVKTETGIINWKELYNRYDIKSSTFSDWLNGKTPPTLEFVISCIRLAKLRVIDVENKIEDIYDLRTVYCKYPKNVKNKSDVGGILSSLKGCKSADGSTPLNQTAEIDVYDKRLAQLIAMTLTDGGISVYGKNGKHYEIFFVQKYPDPIKLFSDIIKQLFGLQVTIRKRVYKENTWYSGHLTSKLVVNQLLKLLKTNGKLTRNKKVPRFIFEEKYLAREFLRILYGSEGCVYIKEDRKPVIEIGCKPINLKKSYRRLLQLFDIECKIYPTKLSILKKSSVKRFVKEIGSLNCFRVVRGKHCGEKKVKVLKNTLSVLQNSPS
ncbi:hypothetical protein HZC32_00430 [Candidatus Woesearchaeota archaeon]|nr:hypothetical protein [Candidatus Woesearchaeota archaeon]